MGININDAKKAVGRVMLRAVGTMRVQIKQDSNKQAYNKFLTDNNIEQSKTGGLSFNREYLDKQTKIKIPSEYIGKKTEIQRFIKAIDANLESIKKPLSSTSAIIENGKMYHQGTREHIQRHQVFPNGFESDPIDTETITKKFYKDRVK